MQFNRIIILVIVSLTVAEQFRNHVRRVVPGQQWHRAGERWAGDAGGNGGWWWELWMEHDGQKTSAKSVR